MLNLLSGKMFDRTGFYHCLGAASSEYYFEWENL